MKTVGIAAINKRLKDISKTFGNSSEVYRKAIKYLKNEVDDEFLKMDANNNIVGIRQTKKAKSAGKLLQFHPEEVNEQVPTVEKLIKEQRELFKESDSLKDQSLAKYNIKDIRTNNSLLSIYIKPIENVYADLNDFDSLVLEVYDVRDNKKGLDNAVFVQKGYEARAKALIAEMSRTADWVRKARQLVTEYLDDINSQKAAWLQARYGK